MLALGIYFDRLLIFQYSYGCANVNVDVGVPYHPVVSQWIHVNGSFYVGTLEELMPQISGMPLETKLRKTLVQLYVYRKQKELILTHLSLESLQHSGSIVLILSPIWVPLVEFWSCGIALSS